LSFTEKSNIFKILKITGISSIVIGLSDIKNHLDGDFLYFFKIFGFIYIIYNFMVLLLRTVSLFSKLFCLINNDFPLFILLESKKEKFFYVLGMLTHFILDVILILVSTILQCYIVDLYFYSVFETKIFCLDIIFVKFLIKKT
ncbi:hypothetical protein, partial [Streptomyces fungicidicus]|uniref:hypothetical protein n=1 Tax=Streptomyces fungicidicus TaxID=68203 RepID=UPI003D70C4B6